RASWLTELGLIDAQHQNDVLLAAIGIVLDHDSTGGLRHAFNDQYARENWVTWEVAGKNRFVIGDVLDANSTFVTIDLDDLVDHQEGITVWQGFQNFTNAHRIEFGHGGRFSHP